MPYNPAEFDVPEVIAAAEEHLFRIDGVTGVGLGTGEAGNDAILVYIEDESVAARLPATFRGLPLVTIVTGIIDIR